MTPLEYLQTNLMSLSIRFSDITIKCGYNDNIESYVVELTPQEEYDRNENLLNDWAPVSLEFNERFMNDNVVFVSSDSGLSVSNPIFVYSNGTDKTEQAIEMYNETPKSDMFMTMKIDVVDAL